MARVAMLVIFTFRAAVFRAPRTAANRRRRRDVGALVIAVAIASVACTAAEAPDSPGALQLSGPSNMVVNQTSMLTVTATNSRGEFIHPTPAVTFASSDMQVAVVSADGVIRAIGSGTATISAKGNGLMAELTVKVNARVVITIEHFTFQQPYWSLTVGDRMRLAVQLVDINGNVTGSAKPAVWHSTNPAAASVDTGGFVIATGPGQVTITASTPEGPAAANIMVYDPIPGFSATIRFAHAAQGVGPITFRSNKLAPVTLRFGESIDLPATYGTFEVEADGLSRGAYGETTFAANLIQGAALSLYAIDGGGWGTLVPAWNTSDPIPADSGLVRIVQGTPFTFPVMYLRPTGAPRSGLPEQCYFDPGSLTDYYVRPGGSFDLLLQQKPSYYFDSTAAFIRLPASVRAGHAITLVLEGDSPANGHYITFDDR